MPQNPRTILDIDKEVEEAIKTGSIKKHFKYLIELVDGMTPQFIAIDEDVGAEAAKVLLRKKLAILRTYSNELRRVVSLFQKHRKRQRRLDRIKKIGEVYDKVFDSKEF